MAGRNCDKRASTPRLSVSQRRPSSSTKPDMSKRVEERPRVKSASGPTNQHKDDLFAQEEQYRLLNAELEAKTADLVKQTEKLMREQNEVLSKPLSTLLLTPAEDENDLRTRQSSAQECKVKVLMKKGAACTGKQGKELCHETVTRKMSQVTDSAAVGDGDDFFLARTIQSMEDRMQEDTVTSENVLDDVGGSVVSGVSDAQIRVLKAKLQIMQEELDQLTCEYYKKDDENAKLSAKIKELEEDRARLQKTTSIQQTQIEKHRALAEESTKKCDGLQVQVSALRKEIENQSRSQKQAAAVQGTVEVRLNRALEEGERLKTQLNKMKQANKDKTSEELQNQEKLLTENKMLKKQKAELIVGFKKQLKLIDTLKRQKMHFEAAKLLSFTEDEFMKALDWGKS
ncbi:testis-expressed protein 9-like isoform X2 [Halichoeres trimaculatus]|uniref:testis-expressed protein 9-like isoform X2 n=1 Tax=Halichoeres trimaculatus TaxID=147232 RepID=UPI003D9DEBC7